MGLIAYDKDYGYNDSNYSQGYSNDSAQDIALTEAGKAHEQKQIKQFITLMKVVNKFGGCGYSHLQSYNDAIF